MGPDDRAKPFQGLLNDVEKPLQGVGWGEMV